METMFCNVCGKSFALEETVTVYIENPPWNGDCIRTCKECGST